MAAAELRQAGLVGGNLHDGSAGNVCFQRFIKGDCMKMLLGSLSLSVLMALNACGAPTTTGSAGSKTETNAAARDERAPVLTKEEVGAVLGSAVISVDGRPADMNYRTAVIGLETTIGIETERDPAMAIDGARKATSMLGGASEDVPHLGDEAFFGAMSILYVRKGDIIITITPPNLQLVAASGAYGKVTDAKLGSEEQAKAMQDLMRVEKTDPLIAGLKGGDDMQGALKVVAAASKKQGTTYETQARAMGLELAAKVLAKL